MLGEVHGPLEQQTRQNLKIVHDHCRSVFMWQQEVQELERRMDALRMRLRATTDSKRGPMPHDMLPSSLVDDARHAEGKKCA